MRTTCLQVREQHKATGIPQYGSAPLEIQLNCILLKWCRDLFNKHTRIYMSKLLYYCNDTNYNSWRLYCSSWVPGIMLLLYSIPHPTTTFWHRYYYHPYLGGPVSLLQGYFHCSKCLGGLFEIIFRASLPETQENQPSNV